MRSNNARKNIIFVLFLILLMLGSILPQPASADLPPGGRWSIQAESTVRSDEHPSITKIISQGEFNDADIKPGTGNIIGTLRYQYFSPDCKPVDVSFPITADLIVWPGSTNSARHLQFIDKNSNKEYQATYTCFYGDGSFYSDTQNIAPAHLFWTYLNTADFRGMESGVPLKEGTYVLEQSEGIWIRINKYTFKPLFCTEIVQIPLVVALINYPSKPDGTPVDRSYVNNFVQGMNDIYKQSCVQFKLELITEKTIAVDLKTETGLRELLEYANTEMSAGFSSTLLDTFKRGNGAMISVVNGLGSSGGKALTGDPNSIVVDTTRQSSQYKDGSLRNVGVDTWAHEMMHAFGYGHDPGNPGYIDSQNPNNLIAPGIDESGNPIRTDAKIPETMKQKIIGEAKKIGKTVKGDPVKVNFIKDWKLDNTSDVFFYTNSTHATGYNFTDLNEVRLSSEEPYSNYDFKLGFEDILSLNQSANLTVRLFFDTDGNPLTGESGYDRIALLNLTDSFPFNGTYTLSILNASDYSQFFTGTTNVTTTINYEELDLYDPSYIPIPFGYDISFNISGTALSELNMSSKVLNVLTQVDYPEALVRDELKFNFSNSPDVSPLLDAIPYNVKSHDNLTVTGIGFSPNTTVNISINNTQIAGIPADAMGNFSINLSVPELPANWYMITAVDTNMSDDFTVINVVKPGPEAGFIVTSPYGGETWQVGTSHEISWIYGGNPGSFVKIELLKGGVVDSIINSSIPIGSNGSGSYNWLINPTQVSGTDYKVRVTSTTNSSYNDTSDTNFNITDSSQYGDWPMVGHDPSHSGVADEVVAPPLELLWNYTTGGYIYGSPVAAGGVVYVGSSGNLYALDASTGALKWNYATGGYIYGSPAVAGGVVYVGSEKLGWDGESNVYALDASTGALKWNYTIVGDISGSPVVAEGVVYVVYVGSRKLGWDRDSNVYALDAYTGALKGNYTIGGSVNSSPSISGGVVYVGSVNGRGDGNLYALDAYTGALKWNYTTKGYGISSPSVSGGVVYVGSGAGNLYALDVSTGALKWKYTTGDYEIFSPSVSGGVVYVESGNGNIYAFDAVTGTLKWKYTTGDTEGINLSTSLAISGGFVYVGSWKNYLYALNASTGALKWNYTTGVYFPSSPAISSGAVYVGSLDHNVYAFAPVKDQQITTDPANQSSPSISGNRIVWTDKRKGNWDIYMYDLSNSTEKQITINSSNQLSPVISGDRIVWEDKRNGSSEIYMFDLSTSTEKQITTNSANQRYPDISGDRIVWQDKRNGNWDIYMYDLSTNTEKQITTYPNYQTAPSISGDRIVWQDKRNGNWDIYMYDLSTSTEKQITTNPANQASPSISGNYIVWKDNRNGNSGIYMYDLSTSTEKQITTDSANKRNPAIHGNNIVWQDYRNGNWDIYMYDLSANTEKRLTTNSAIQSNPSISGNNIVWQDYRNGNWDIYMTDLSI